MAKVVKSCDLPGYVASKLFQALNPNEVRYVKVYGQPRIITNIEPKELTYPEGWYYAKGGFRNKHKSTTGGYSHIPMFTSEGVAWDEIARYCTLDD